MLFLGIFTSCAVIPGVDEGIRGDGCSVGECPPVFESDGKFCVVWISCDGLGDLVMRLTIFVVGHKAAIQKLEDLGTI